MITCTRRLQFCAGHRVFGHENKCAHLHGHNYVIFLTANASGLDSVGRIVDFSVLKEHLGGWIDANWDHGFIYFEQDTELAGLFAETGGPLEWSKSFALPVNPTAENMAEYMLREVGPSVLNANVQLTKVVLWETENCYATATL